MRRRKKKQTAAVPVGGSHGVREWWSGKDVPPKSKDAPVHIPGRREQLRLGRTVMFTVVALVAHVLFKVGMGILEETYVLNWAVGLTSSSWSWFFWPSLAAFWAEELIGTDKEGRKAFNVWPKGVLAFYIAMLLISVFCTVTALITGHDLYIIKARESVSREKTDEKITKLEEELRLATEGDEDGFTRKGANPFKISAELQKLRAKKIFLENGGEDIAGFALRFQATWEWFLTALSWFLTIVFLILVVIPVYGLEAISGLVSIVSPFLRIIPGGKILTKK